MKFQRHLLVGFSTLVVVLPLCAPRLLGQSTPEAPRKILQRVTPQYPSLARSLSLVGSVRADVLVLPNGSVKAVEIKGGHPLLAQSSQNALREWKWEPAEHETHETVELRFSH
jgi:TonB family protein